jgi:membrane associated rhomboid family serine protease
VPPKANSTIGAIQTSSWVARFRHNLAGLVAASAWHVPWLSWAAAAAGLGTGVLLVGYLGRRAIGRLQARQVSVRKVLAEAAR